MCLAEQKSNLSSDTSHEELGYTCVVYFCVTWTHQIEKSKLTGEWQTGVFDVRDGEREARSEGRLWAQQAHKSFSTPSLDWLRIVGRRRERGLGT